MKRISLFTILSLTYLVSCHNIDIEYDDYKYTTAYFPYQFPVRTIVLGDYIFDNSNDNSHKFLISAAIGGLYSNKSKRTVHFTVDESLCDNVLFEGTNDTIRILPLDYYTLSSPNEIVIPEGKFNGGVEVQLTEAFFNDPKAIKLCYVVPLRLTDTKDVDSILQGKSEYGISSPDPRDKVLWEILPKHFTMFAVKFINEFHGSYLQSGECKLKDKNGNTIESSVYRGKYPEQNPVVKLITTERHQVSLKTFFKSQEYTGEFEILLNFNGNNCTVSAPESSKYTITGKGVFKEKQYSWGNKNRDGIELQYSIANEEISYEAKDTLVIRDRGVVMELFSPVLF